MVNERQVEYLTELMVAEQGCYDELLDRSRDHHEALLGGEPTAVESSLRAQIKSVERCRAASEQRVMVSRELSVSMGLGEDCGTGRLIARLPGDGGALRKAHGRLSERTVELQELNGFNRRLTEHRLDLMQGDLVSMQSIIARAAGRTDENGEPLEGSLISLKA
jgi:hypothetical protein